MRCAEVATACVLVMIMKFDGVVTVAFGLLSVGVLVRFRASARN